MTVDKHKNVHRDRLKFIKREKKNKHANVRVKKWNNMKMLRNYYFARRHSRMDNCQ
jgi:hypothetical protein